MYLVVNCSKYCSATTHALHTTDTRLPSPLLPLDPLGLSSAPSRPTRTLLCSVGRQQARHCHNSGASQSVLSDNKFIKYLINQVLHLQRQTSVDKRPYVLNVSELFKQELVIERLTRQLYNKYYYCNHCYSTLFVMTVSNK